MPHTHERMHACAFVHGRSVKFVNGTSGDAVGYFHVRANFFVYVSIVHKMLVSVCVRSRSNMLEHARRHLRVVEQPK